MVIFAEVTQKECVKERYPHCCRYCKWKIIVCGLPIADRQRYIDKFKSLGIDNCPYETRRTEWTDDAVALQDGVDNMTKLLSNDVHHLLSPGHTFLLTAVYMVIV